jgi:hypothetical protein
MPPEISKDRFEELYRQYNRREFVHPDPIEFLYHYEDLYDREIVAFVASSLAYGRVAYILESISSVLKPCAGSFPASDTGSPATRSFAPCYSV